MLTIKQTEVIRLIHLWNQWFNLFTHWVWWQEAKWSSLIRRRCYCVSAYPTKQCEINPLYLLLPEGCMDRRSRLLKVNISIRRQSVPIKPRLKETFFLESKFHCSLIEIKKLHTPAGAVSLSGQGNVWIDLTWHKAWWKALNGNHHIESCYNSLQFSTHHSVCILWSCLKYPVF